MQVEGVYTAVVTPFDDADVVDADALAQLVEHIAAGGGEGIVALGTVGDGMSVDLAERRLVLDAVRDAAAGRCGLIGGATALTTREAIRNATLVREAGYGCAMVAPPPYLLPTPGDLAAHFRAVAEESGIPVLLYDYPERVGVQVGFDVLDALVDVPGVIGLKEAAGDIARIVELRARYGERFQVVSGADTLIVDMALWGARGWIAGASGFLPAQHSEILRLGVEGRFAEAKERHAALLQMFLSMERGGYPQKVRAGLEAFGLPARNPRAPMRPLDADARAAFLATLAPLRVGAGV